MLVQAVGTGWGKINFPSIDCDFVTTGVSWAYELESLFVFRQWLLMESAMDTRDPDQIAEIIVWASAWSELWIFNLFHRLSVNGIISWFICLHKKNNLNSWNWLIKNQEKKENTWIYYLYKGHIRGLLLLSWIFINWFKDSRLFSWYKNFKWNPNNSKVKLDEPKTSIQDSSAKIQTNNNY